METIPKLSRVALLRNPQASSAQSWKESQLAARELGLRLHSMEVSSADKYEGAFKEAIEARSDALIWMSAPLGSSNQKQTWTCRKDIGCQRFTLGELLSRVVA